LVCHAKNCPKLRSEVFVSGKLAERLDVRSQGYLASPAGLPIDRERQVVSFASFYLRCGEDIFAGHSAPSEFSGRVRTENALSRYLSASDRDNLQSGAYSVRYLDDEIIGRADIIVK
jgi:hypothetical protein